MSNDDRFNVVVVDPDDFWRYAERDLPAKEAVEMSKTLVDLATISLGNDISRVMITDSGDACVFLWERGRGILFPTGAEKVTLSTSMSCEGR